MWLILTILILALAPDSVYSKTDQSDYYYQPDDTKPIALDFVSPYEMLLYADSSIRSGYIELHPWQIETQYFLASKNVFTKKTPLKYILRAANGSGKDAYVIAPFAVWFICSKIRTRVIITSSSKAQLKLQSEAYIRAICLLLNVQLAQDGVTDNAFIIQRNHIVCTLTGSEIILFATNEGGKAEGYHPFPDCPTQELAIIINEAKSIDQNIFDHLGRCTYSHWLEISSPGIPSGHMYTMYCMARAWEDGCIPGTPFTRKITSYDCKHIDPQKIEQDKLELGELSPVFRSKHLAEFTTEGESVVFGGDLVDAVWNLRTSIKEIPVTDGYHGNRAGLDLSGGGDEQVLTVIRNNVVLVQEIYKMHDTDELVNILIQRFKEHSLKEEYIHVDDGGIGQAILDNFNGKGWALHRVLNQSSPVNNKYYGNRGAELWYNMKRLFEAKLIKFCISDTDRKLRQQLTSRYYTQHAATGKLVLEAKKDARSNGHPSPDRGDSLCLAFAGLNIFDFNPGLAGKLGENNLKVRKVMAIESHKEIAKSLEVSSRYESGKRIFKCKEFRSNRHRDYAYLGETAKKTMIASSNPITIMRKLLTG